MLGSGLSNEDMDEFMREADVVRELCCTSLMTHWKMLFYFQDGNGKLDYDEFVKMMLKY